MNSPEPIQKLLQELEERFASIGGQILAQMDNAIDAIEKYKNDPAYYQRLVDKREELGRQLKDLKRKTEEIL